MGMLIIVQIIRMITMIIEKSYIKEIYDLIAYHRLLINHMLRMETEKYTQMMSSRSYSPTPAPVRIHQPYLYEF